MLTCSTIFLENEAIGAIVISGTQKAVNVVEKVFRKVKTETSMPGDDLWLSLDNVVMGEMFAEAQSISRRGGNPTPSRFSRLSPRTGEGEAVDRDQREGGEDAGRVRGEVPLHAAGDGSAPDRVQIHAGGNININLNNFCSYHLLVTFRFNKVLINLKIDCRKSLRATSTISKDGDFHTLTININKMEIKLVFRNYEVKCNVCKTNQGKFSFPIDEEKPQKWMTLLGIDRPKIVGANSSRFCLDHFSLNQE